MRRQLSSYSSSSSTNSSPDFYPSLSTDGSYSSACGEGPPPAHQPLFFRRNSSMESVARGYESPEEEEEMMEDESEHHHTSSSAAAATSTDGNGAHPDGSSSGGSTLGSAVAAVGCQRTPRNLAGVPRTIVEDEDQALAAAVLAPIYADLAIARTRSMPLPRHEVASPTAAAAAAAGAAAIAASSSSSSSSSSLLPGAQPGFGSSQSWTPGLAPPLPYAHITPLHSPLDDHNEDNNHSSSGGGAYGDEEQSDDLPPPTVISFAPLLPQSAAAHAAQAESDDLPPHPMFDSSAYSHISRAPPPSRAPSLVRQKGVYVEATSRTFSLPLDYASRLREQQRMAREVQEREEMFQQQLQAAGALLPQQLQQQQPHTPTPPTSTRYVRRRD